MSANIAAGTRLRLQPLTYVSEDDGVLVGRPDTGSYGVFPAAGADLLRLLEAGATLEWGAQQWHDQTGEMLDTADFVAVLEDLRFLVTENDPRSEPSQVRWQRLARVLFSPSLWLLYAAVVAGGLATMIVDPGLRPDYRDVFFTTQISLIPVVLALFQMPLLVLHEGFHALAARRLGLPSTLGIGRRFYYLVAETRLNSLYSVPRAQRFLPFLAGSLVDAVGVGAFTMLSAAARHWGAPPWLSGLALALAFSGILRILWQCLFYMETDFYFVINAASGCTDLHSAARHQLRTLLRAVVRRVLRRPAEQAVSAEQWSERDLAAARWYAPLMVAGYGVSLGLLLLVGLPTAVRFWTIMIHRFDGSQPQSPESVIDTGLFILLAVAQLGLLAHVTIRDLRRRYARTSLKTELKTDLETERNAS
jgi:hypothetical protein